ncbi:MAG: hypothetical protein NTY67_10775 [Cyanobacteria bacterium]|nr:hypothetical protein [Cyanobacteriota bacterium]
MAPQAGATSRQSRRKALQSEAFLALCRQISQWVRGCVFSFGIVYRLGSLQVERSGG